VGKVISLLFAPAQNPCLVQQSARPRFCLVDLSPFRNRVLFGSIGATAAGKSILQHSCLMREQPLILSTFCADVKAYVRLRNSPIHQNPVVSLTGWSSGELRSFPGDLNTICLLDCPKQEANLPCKRLGRF
jgi:hypothetical protein